MKKSALNHSDISSRLPETRNVWNKVNKAGRPSRQQAVTPASEHGPPGPEDDDPATQQSYSVPTAIALLLTVAFVSSRGREVDPHCLGGCHSLDKVCWSALRDAVASCSEYEDLPFCHVRLLWMMSTVVTRHYPHHVQLVTHRLDTSLAQALWCSWLC